MISLLVNTFDVLRKASPLMHDNFSDTFTEGKILNRYLIKKSPRVIFYQFFGMYFLFRNITGALVSEVGH